jgi:hypothetical protein
LQLQLVLYSIQKPVRDTDPSQERVPGLEFLQSCTSSVPDDSEASIDSCSVPSQEQLPMGVEKGSPQQRVRCYNSAQRFGGSMQLEHMEDDGKDSLSNVS